MNNMAKVYLSEVNGDYIIQYSEPVGSRKLMKTSIFLDGIQGITHIRINAQTELLNFEFHIEKF